MRILIRVCFGLYDCTHQTRSYDVQSLFNTALVFLVVELDYNSICIRNTGVLGKLRVGILLSTIMCTSIHIGYTCLRKSIICHTCVR